MRPTVEQPGFAAAVPRELFQAVLGHLREGVLVSDAAGRRLHASERAAELRGYAG